MLPLTASGHQGHFALQAQGLRDSSKHHLARRLQVCVGLPPGYQEPASGFTKPLMFTSAATFGHRFLCWRAECSAPGGLHDLTLPAPPHLWFFALGALSYQESGPGKHVAQYRVQNGPDYSSHSKQVETESTDIELGLGPPTTKAWS